MSIRYYDIFNLNTFKNEKIMRNVDMLYFKYITIIYSTDSKLKLIVIINII